MRHGALLNTAAVVHVEHPARSIEACSAEKDVDVAGADEDFGEGVAEDVDDVVVGPVRFLEANQAYAGE